MGLRKSRRKQPVEPEDHDPNCNCFICEQWHQYERDGVEMDDENADYDHTESMGHEEDSDYE